MYVPSQDRKSWVYFWWIKQLNCVVVVSKFPLYRAEQLHKLVLVHTIFAKTYFAI